MNTVQRIAKNTGVLLIAQIASYIIGFFFIMYTARYLGAAGFGINPFCKQKAFTKLLGKVLSKKLRGKCFAYLLLLSLPEYFGFFQIPNGENKREKKGMFIIPHLK